MPRIYTRKYPDVMVKPYCVYRIYDVAGSILYIGATRNINSRLTSHAGTKKWWKSVDVSAIRIEWCDDAEDASRVECNAIELERPLYNIHGTGGRRASLYRPPPRRIGLNFAAMSEAELQAWRDHQLDEVG